MSPSGPAAARSALELPVIVADETRSGGGIPFASCSVTTTGATLPSDVLFEVGEVLALAFDLPDGRTIHCRGRVVSAVRDRANGRIPGMDVEFVDISPDDRTAIAKSIP